MATSSAISNGGAWFNISVSKYFSPEFLIVPSRQRCPYFSFDNMSPSTTLKTGRTEFLYDQVKRIKNYIKFLRKIFLPYAKLLYYIKLLNFYFDFVLSSYIPYKKEDSSRRFVLSIKSLKSPLTWFTKSNNLKKKKKLKFSKIYRINEPYRYLYHWFLINNKGKQKKKKDFCQHAFATFDLIFSLLRKNLQRSKLQCFKKIKRKIPKHRI